MTLFLIARSASSAALASRCALEGIGSGSLLRRTFRHDRRRHRLLGDIDRAAQRACDLTGARLGLEVGAGAKPALELVSRGTSEAIFDHEPCTSDGAFELATTTSKSRSCSNDGIFRRHLVDIGSVDIGNDDAWGSIPASAKTSPQGEMMRLCPNVSRPFSCRPPWPAARI